MGKRCNNNSKPLPKTKKKKPFTQKKCQYSKKDERTILHITAGYFKDAPRKYKGESATLEEEEEEEE